MLAKAFERQQDRTTGQFVRWGGRILPVKIFPDPHSRRQGGKAGEQGPGEKQPKEQHTTILLVILGVRLLARELHGAAKVRRLMTSFKIDLSPTHPRRATCAIQPGREWEVDIKSVLTAWIILTRTSRNQTG